MYSIAPLPLSEQVACLFAAFLSHQGLKPQTISAYLSAVRHLQISAGLNPTIRTLWPRLQYILRGIKRSQDALPQRVRLPVTVDVMRSLQAVWARAPAESQYNATMLWAASCLGYFGFMRAGEFTLVERSAPPAILSSDVSVDSHSNPSVLRVLLRRAKTDPFGKGVLICMGRTGNSLCPVAALLGFLSIRPAGVGPLFTFQDGSPLTRERFVKEVRVALTTAQIDHRAYSGHSFRIGAATMAAQAGLPAYLIKMLGRWNSEAYQQYIRTPRETLAAVSQAIAP